MLAGLYRYRQLGNNIIVCYIMLDGLYHIL